MVWDRVSMERKGWVKESEREKGRRKGRERKKEKTVNEARSPKREWGGCVKSVVSKSTALGTSLVASSG